MAINRVEIKDFLVFKGDFAVDFCPGVNVLIGGNATGKTTLLKVIYHSYCLFRGKPYGNKLMQTSSYSAIADAYLSYFSRVNSDISPEIYSDVNGRSFVKETKHNMFAIFFNLSSRDYHPPDEQNMRCLDISAIYIPEKDILEHAKGLLTFTEQKDTDFGRIYRDVLITAQDVNTKKQSEMQEAISSNIAKTIGGKVEWTPSEGRYYTVRSDGARIPFANEASGFKKLGYLELLVRTGHLESGSVLFWDEPENSLNPELVPVLVDILLELSRNGVQIFLATHSDFLCKWFELKTGDGHNADIEFFSLYKENGTIRFKSSQSYTMLEHNSIIDQSVELYNEHLRRATEHDED
ncbi:MAG: AAA family ATPase [Gracilibacteraceae bacterium]|jgi:AAA15 family ATPase/GTPase|nr:AAA family ATPase [Gracilibacteraceae bacterium]